MFPITCTLSDKKRCSNFCNVFASTLIKCKKLASILQKQDACLLTPPLRALYKLPSKIFFSQKADIIWRNEISSNILIYSSDFSFIFSLEIIQKIGIKLVLPIITLGSDTTDIEFQKKCFRSSICIFYVNRIKFSFIEL
jgi:hypothetical protein